MIFEEQISRKPDNYPWTQDFIEAMHNGFRQTKNLASKAMSKILRCL